MKHLLRLTAALLAALMIFGGAFAEEKPTLQLHQIMMGCADAYLVKCGEKIIMIDGGNDTGYLPTVLVDYLKQAGIDRLDAYIVTHYHFDHAGNMNLILEAYGDDDTVVYGPSEEMFAEYAPIAAGQYRQMRPGDEILIGDIRIDCVGPETVECRGATNRDSLNFLITYGQRRIFMTGDFVRSREVMRDYGDMLENIDVLKFPHHGIQPFCVDPWVVKILSPEVILIPGVGRWRVLDMMKQFDIPACDVYDSGHGNIVLLTDGESLDIIPDVLPGQFATRSEI